AALPERVDAEPRQALSGVGDVEVTRLVEEVVALGRDLGDGAEATVEVGVRQRLEALERRNGAVAPDHRGPVQLQVDVRGAGRDRAPEKIVEIHTDTVVGRDRREL